MRPQFVCVVPTSVGDREAVDNATAETLVEVLQRVVDACRKAGTHIAQTLVEERIGDQSRSQKRKSAGHVGAVLAQPQVVRLIGLYCLPCRSRTGDDAHNGV